MYIRYSFTHPDLGGPVSVRSSLLAILTMGPAYGFQLHGELVARTAGRRIVNVGQIYGTLERLVAHGSVESAGSTTDGLPLYQLTGPGRAEAMSWLHDTSSAGGDDWNEMLERVLIASSLPHVDTRAVVRAYHDVWSARLAATTTPGVQAGGQADLSAAADAAQADAALAWLAGVTARLADPAGAPGAAGNHRFHRELSLDRPKRGRRPTLRAAG
jgi:DNA-binding PadR family transcriptional regulator